MLHVQVEHLQLMQWLVQHDVLGLMPYIMSYKLMKFYNGMRNRQ